MRADMTLYAGYYQVTAYPSAGAKANEPVTSKLVWTQARLSAEDSYSVELVNVYTGATLALQGNLSFDESSNQVTYAPTTSIPAGFYNVTIKDSTQAGHDLVLKNVLLGGDGTEANPYPIGSALDFEAVSKRNVAEGVYYALYADITISPFRNDQEGYVFEGTLLGRGLTITLDLANCGAIYKVGPSGRIYNINVAGALVTEVDCVGALVDINLGTIEKVTSIANVTSTAGLVGSSNINKTLDDSSAVGSRGIAGCIVGINYGTIVNSKVSSSDSTNGIVKANIGGGLFAGYNAEGGVISNCSTNGVVGAANTKLIAKSTSKYSYAGCIAGINDGTIEKCLVQPTAKILAQRYASAELAAAAPGTNNSNIGGIVGWNRSTGTISECMFSGIRVHGDENVGGIAGANDGTITSCAVEGDLHSERSIVTYVGGRINVGGIVGLQGEGSTVSNCFVTANVFGFTADTVYKIAKNATNSVYLSANPNAGTNSVADDYSSAAGYNEAAELKTPADPQGTGNVVVAEATDGSANINLSASYLTTLGDKFYHDGTTVRFAFEKNIVPEQTIVVSIYKDGWLWKDVTLGETPTTIEAPYSRGQSLAGWATKADATEYEFAADRAISLYNLQNYTVDGKVNLYPIYTTADEQTDLKVMFWVNANKWMSEEDINTVKTEFEALKSSDYKIEWIISEETKVADLGAEVNEIGDIDVIIGCGTNVTTTGKVETLNRVFVDAENANFSEAFRGRQVALLTDGKLSMELFAYVTGLESLEIEVTINGDNGSKVSSLNNLLENEATLPIVAVPEGKLLAGWATTADATEEQIATGAITYTSVKDLAVDGKVTLYPVIIVDAKPVITDTVMNVAVWTKDGSWVTDEEWAKIESEFNAYLQGYGYNVTVVFTEVRVDGNKVAALGELTNAGVSEGVPYDIIIGCGNNVNSTAGVTIVEKANIGESLIAAGRMMARLTENTIAIALYNWIANY